MKTEMVALTDFSYENTGVRILGTKLEPWFVAVDVLKALGIHTKNVSRIIESLDDDEKGVINLTTEDDSSVVNLTTEVEIVQGSHNTVWIISEPGLYKIMLRARTPKAEAFTRFVTHEVLPQIRKYGFYDPNHVRDGKLGRPRLSECVKAQREREKQVQRSERLKKSCETKKKYVLANGERLDIGDLRMVCRSLGASLEFVSGSTKRMIAFIDEEMLRLEIASFKEIL